MNVKMTTRGIRAFRGAVWSNFRGHGRHELLWRKTKDPYKILVSEIMLQQTQVARVTAKYVSFLKQFPSFSVLARVPLDRVLVAWQGLGYNRRAKFLHLLAKDVVKKYKGRLPASEAELLELPGIGKATASAVMAFAFNKPAVYFETNVRSAFLHYFFKGKSGVADSELLPLIKAAAEGQDPRTWNWALLDFGAQIKQAYGNPNRHSKQYAKQSAFKGSLRQTRGEVLRALSGGPLTRAELRNACKGSDAGRFLKACANLQKEGFIVAKGNTIRLGT